MSVSLSHELMGLLDGLKDLVVSGAAAQIAHHPILNLILIGPGIFIEQSLGCDHLPWSADAALKPAILNETFLYWMKFTVFGKPFDGGDVVAVGHHGERDAGTDHFTIHQHCAGAADTDAATFFGSS